MIAHLAGGLEHNAAIDRSGMLGWHSRRACR
jgi:hypothetical protein